MWSILTDPMPEYIMINDTVYFGVHTDFRVWLRVSQMISEASSEVDQDLLQKLFDMTVIEDQRPNGYILAPDFLDGLMRFFAGPQKDEPDPDEPDAPKMPKVLDYTYDSDFIYQSFASLYNIRLTEVEYMHWWEFLTLFTGLMLSEGNSLNFVVGIRQRKMSDVPKSQKAAYAKMKKVFALPKSEEETKATNAVWDRLEKMWSEDQEEENNG